MWIRTLHLVLIGVYLQVQRCYPSCTLYTLVANCASQGHFWVPTLPPFITHLYLEFNYISELNSTSLAGLEHLQQLDLGKQHVPLIIRNEAFARQKSLTRLVLGDNMGLKLEPKAFAGLFSLQNLYLDHCGLTESILTESYLQPLFSLTKLDLFGNKIQKLQPGKFFVNLTEFTELNLKLNQIQMLCEEDLVGFRGKYFKLLNLDSNHLFRIFDGSFDWDRCGNPFRGMGFHMLDLSTNSFSITATRLFLKLIEGTPIGHLIMHGYMGKGFSHDNLADPDNSTFEGLARSGVRILDISKNDIFSLQRAIFSHLSDVMIIDLYKNKINRINRNAFDGLQGHLLLLNLSSNLIGEIHSYTFTNLTQLLLLDLSYNHIGVLGYKAFSSLPNLKNLFLTGNSLRNLGHPATLPNLKILLLADNKLNAASLSSIIALGKSSIMVDISDNKLNNLEDIYVILTQFKDLQYFYFGGNVIKWCTLNQNVAIPRVNHLKDLDLHDSSLQVIWAQETCLDIFDHLKSLLWLNLSSNSLATLPQGIFSGLRSVVVIDLSFNALTYFQHDVFPPSLQTLHLLNNFLASPDPATFQSLSSISLMGNRFHCDCKLERFLRWLETTNVTFTSPIEEYRCEFPADVYNLPLLNYSRIVKPCEDDEKAVQGLRLALFPFCALFVTVVIVSGIGYAHLRGHVFIIYKKILGWVVEGSKPPAGKLQYDAYFCFSDRDYRWVETALLKKLDNQFLDKNILHCCFEARDFLPGMDHLSNIRDAIWGSRKTVCIVSKAFLNDGWCLEAFKLAQGRMLEELTNVLIMLVVGKVPHYQLMKYNAVRTFVQKREYLIWPEDPQDLEWFYERLVLQILKDTKLKKVAKGKEEAAQFEIQREKPDEIQLQPIRAVVVNA
ncbi:toll-like receptor 5 isoform X2 [Thalassophryne amazonica]|nr:toll-like receptor 5 isoform X2 [Thalassophryne amazonica]XP_034018792.1 toll-like receptor 5 isoform X2 [Thalassophryne amazonica]